MSNEGSTALAKLSAASRALAEAKTLDEVKQIRDVALAAQTYARAAKLGLGAQNHAAEVTLRAERKAGELLKRLERDERAGAGRPPQIASNVGRNFEPSEYAQTLEETGTSRQDAVRWQTIADLPEPVFEQHIAEQQAAAQELTTASMLRMAMVLKREQVAAEKCEQSLPIGKYRVFYADPPWAYRDSGVITADDAYGRATRHYPTMSLAELCDMGEAIKAIAEDDAVLFLWVTSPLLEDSFQVIKAWGFQYKTSFVWDKVAHNFGHYNSVRHEFLLVCTRGSCTPDVRTLFDSVQCIEKNHKHSEKPEEFRKIIDTLYPLGRRLELFARTETKGWEVWGNECN